MDKRDENFATFSLGQPIFTAGMTPLEKMTKLHTMTNLVIQLLTNRERDITDLRDEVAEQVLRLQYSLFVDPATAEEPNPKINNVFNGMKGIIRVLGERRIFRPRGGRLVGSGLWEQIQHHSRILDSTATKLNKLRQRHAGLIRKAETLGQALQERGEQMGMNIPQVQQLQGAFAKLEGQIAQLEAKSTQLSNLIEQLHVQLENQGGPVGQQDENDENA